MNRDGPDAELEIPVPGPRRAGRLAAWAVGLIASAGLLTLLFSHLAGSLKIAVVLVVFMLAFMLMLARLAGGGERRDW